jgi:hypothetical protein
MALKGDGAIRPRIWTTWASPELVRLLLLGRCRISFQPTKEAIGHPAGRQVIFQADAGGRRSLVNSIGTTISLGASRPMELPIQMPTPVNANIAR